jgi:GT2 family glycosyltransferase
MNEAEELTFAAMITTRNRREELRITLSRLLELQPQPDEILICADGCTDGTGDMIRREFPTCTLIENESPRGSVFSRDRLLRLSGADLVASFDDDSYPLDHDFFSRARHLFEKRSEVAVLSFPEIRDDGSFANSSKTTSSPSHLVSAYANCAAVMRRDVYLRSDGFPVFFGHMYEEPDFALQCYALGKVVRFEPTLTIRHHVTATERNPIRRHQLNARNELWSVWLRCPWPWLPLVSFYRIWRQLQYAFTEGVSWAIQEPVWWLSALRGLPICLSRRKPVAWTIYLSWMRLARNPFILSNSDSSDGR